MIVSHKHRYVYVEVPRTGSTAVSRELRDMYDGTPVLRKHASYRDFLRQATPQERRYFVFSGIRNPLDVAVTRFTNMKSNARGHFTNPEDVAVRNSIAGRIERRIFSWIRKNDADFESFLLTWYRLPYDTWTSLDHKRMNKIIRFERLSEDFEDALRKIGLDPLRPLPVHNATPGRDRDFVSQYTPRAIKRAVWVFGPYMEEWGYEFPASWGPVKVPLAAKIMMRILRVFRGMYWKYLRFGDYVKKRPGGMLPRGVDT
jgi:hypothetical protein